MLCAARVSVAQTTEPRPASGGAIHGVVYDSIAKAPLAGADVQLVAAENSALLGPTSKTDALGRYALVDVPDGRYRIGFFHPVLDSIGIDVPPREVSVASHREVRVDLAIPAPSRIRAAVCGTAAAQDQGALVVGVVRDAANSSPAANVKVTGEWMEIAIDKGGMFRRMPTRIATTGDNGWFALCNVPSGGTMTLTANRGADSTDKIEVIVPPEGFLRHELYIGLEGPVTTASTARTTDSTVRESPRIRYGNGRLSGSVIAGASGKPLAGAQVSIVGGPRVITNEHGEFVITSAPMGSRTLDVRSLGYYPYRQSVDVIPEAAPVRVMLSTFRAVLDTVRIRARRAADRHDSGFEQRRRSLAGTYLTAEDIAKRGANFTSGIFNSIPRVRLVYPLIQMRGAFEEWCVPEFYIDGHFLYTQTAEELDAAMLPKDIAAIEVYSEATVPPQFSQGMGGCGSIVIWTK